MGGVGVWRKMGGNEANTVLHIKFSKMFSKRMNLGVCSLVHVLSVPVTSSFSKFKSKIAFTQG